MITIQHLDKHNTVQPFNNKISSWFIDKISIFEKTLFFC